MEEIRQLRLQLERTIENNDKLRQKLSELLLRTEGDSKQQTEIKMYRHHTVISSNIQSTSTTQPGMTVSMLCNIVHKELHKMCTPL